MKILKDFLVPTERNDMVPFLLSRSTFVFYAILAIGLILSPAYIKLSQLASLSNPLSFGAKDVVALVNQARTTAGLSPLAESSALEKAAASKVSDMFTRQYFAHFAPTDKKSPWDFFRESEYPYLAAGENLAIDFSTAGEAHEALMKSPTHRANILNTLYTEIGVAAYQDTFQGRPSILIAQYFGKPKTQNALKTAVAVTAKPAVSKPAPVVVPQNTAPSRQVAAATTTTKTEQVSVETPIVLGTKSGLDEGLRGKVDVKEVLLGVFANPQLEAKMFAILAIFSLLFPLAFMLLRGAAPTEVLFRTLVLVLLFAYTALFGIGDVSSSKVTPSSASIISLYEDFE